MRWVLSIFFVNCFLLASGQSVLDKVQSNIQSGDLALAEQDMQTALSDPALQSDSRARYLAGFLYKDLYLKASGEQREMYRKEAINNVDKGISIGDPAYEQQLFQLRDYLYSTFFNDGVEAFNNGEYVSATESFEEFIGGDTQGGKDILNDAYYYAGVGYYIAGDDDKALEYFLKNVENGYQNALMFNDLANIYLTRNQLDQANAHLTSGLAIEPGNRELRITELNILSARQDYGSASKKMESYLTDFPNDFDALLMAGTIYEKVDGNEAERYEKIKGVYQKALQLKPTDFHANYNYGVTLYNRGVDLITGKDYDVTLKELNAVLKESSQLFAEAMPYLEKSKNERPKDIALLKALRGIYYNLDKSVKYEAINQELNALGVTD
jgi:tetratricopeptide (TPR) repeat protein